MWSACSASLGVAGEIPSSLQRTGEDMGCSGSVTVPPAGQEDPSLVHHSCFNLLVWGPGGWLCSAAFLPGHPMGCVQHCQNPPSQAGRSFTAAACGTLCCKHQAKNQPLTSPAPLHSICGQISWWSQQGGPQHGSLRTTAMPAPAMAPVAEGGMCFTADGGKTWLCLENE